MSETFDKSQVSETIDIPAGCQLVRNSTWSLFTIFETCESFLIFILLKTQNFGMCLNHSVHITSYIQDSVAILFLISILLGLYKTEILFDIF